MSRESDLQCESCHERPAAFRLKHGETTEHWRCLGCFRSIAGEAPIVVTGVTTKRRTIKHAVPLVQLHRLTRAIYQAFKGVPSHG